MRLLTTTLYAAFVLGKFAASVLTEEPFPPESSSNKLPSFPTDSTAQVFDGKTDYSGPIPEVLPANALPPFPEMKEINPLYLLTLVDIGSPALLLHSFVRPHNTQGAWRRSITQIYFVPQHNLGRWRVREAPTEYGRTFLEERIRSFRPLAYLDPGTKPPAVLAVVKEVAFPRGAVGGHAGVQAEWVESAMQALRKAEGVSLEMFPWA
ncbi:MAG: hypothetical protein M1829_003134 [Trizodia sp. TS-e1964]|nr:MAG: hypothetical protein M1829_003134 [Trizodia sp. TS-e1964]